MRSGKIAFLASVIKGGRYHLWFLPLIVGLYVLVPVMRKVVEDIRLIGYFLILAFIFTFLIPAVLSVKFPEGSVFNILATAFYGMYSNMKFYFTLGYTAFFVAGYFFETISLHTHIRYFIYFTGIGAVCITIGVTYYTAMHSITLDNAFYFLFDLFGALAFFVFVKYKAALESLSVKKEQYIKSIANHVFGIYLVHVMVIDELRQAGMNVRKIPIIQVPFNTMLVFGISLGITYCLRKIPLIKRIV